MSSIARSVGRIIRLGSSGQPISSKYRNKPTMVQGIRFDSKKEATRYQQLQLLERNGELRDIVRQKEYRLVVAGVLIAKYRADFEYDELRDGEWRHVVEDVKGQKDSAAYRIFNFKKKLMRAVHGVEIRET